MSTIRNRASLLALALAAACLGSAQSNVFYGGDLDQEKAKDKAKDNGDKFRAEGYKTGLGSNIGAEQLCDDMRADLASEFNGDKLKCNNGMAVVYVSAHGGLLNGKTAIGNREVGRAVLLSEWATCVTGMIPECCTLVFALDACSTGQWWDENFLNGEPRETSPFRGINAIIALPTAGDRCPGTPVGDAIMAGFGTRRNVAQYGDFLGSQPGVRTVTWADDQHRATIVTVPDPASLVGFGLAACLVGRARRRRC
jgi:hypothetical protein